MSYKTPPNGNLSTGTLPVLQQITNVYNLWYDFLPNIPRLTKYSLGEKINILFIELIETILLATYASKERKLEIIERASTKLDTLKYFLRIAWELNVLDNKKYAAMNVPIAEAGKMLGGWRKQFRPETPLL